MRRFLRKIGVVVIEITDTTAGRKRRPIRRCLVVRADNGRAMFRRKFRCDFPRNPAGLFVPCAQGATDRVDYPALHFTYSFARQIFETQSASVFGKLMRERFGHEKIGSCNVTMSSA